jgi:hypothetical protein
MSSIAANTIMKDLNIPPVFGRRRRHGGHSVTDTPGRSGVTGHG